MTKLLLRPEAEEDLRAAWAWYEQERLGLGDELLHAVRQRLDSILDGPRRFARVYRDVRRALVTTFPFAVFFVEEPNQVIVLAVQHTARDPDLWSERTRR